MMFESLGRERIGWFIAYNVLAMLLVNVHNTALAIIAALVLCHAIPARLPFTAAAYRAAQLGAIPLSSWMVVRWILGLGRGHSFLYSKYSLVEYAQQSVSGIGQLWAPETFSTATGVASGILLTSMYPKLRLQRAKKTLLLFSVLVLGLQTFMFSVVWINDPIAGRFLWVVLLGLTPFFFFYREGWLGALVLVFAVGTTTIQLYRATKWAFFIDNTDTGFPINAEISTEPPAGERLKKGKAILISPPVFEEKVQ
jgi:hypothetical protein